MEKNKVKVPPKVEARVRSDLQEDHTFMGDSGSVNSEVALEILTNNFFAVDSEDGPLELTGKLVDGIVEGERVPVPLEEGQIVIAQVFWDLQQERVGIRIPTQTGYHATARISKSDNEELKEQIEEWNDNQLGDEDPLS